MHHSNARFVLLAAALALALSVLGHHRAAHAQSAFGAWAISCVAEGPRDTQCALFHRQVIENSGAILLEVQLVGLEVGRTPTLLITVPLGANLPDQLGAKIDESVDQSFEFSTCGNRGCTVRIQNSELIDRFSEGIELQVTYHLGVEDKREVERTVSLFGVQEGIDKIKSAEIGQE